MPVSRTTTRPSPQLLSGKGDIRVNRRFSPSRQSRDMVRGLIAAHYNTL